MTINLGGVPSEAVAALSSLSSSSSSRSKYRRRQAIPYGVTDLLEQGITKLWEYKRPIATQIGRCTMWDSSARVGSGVVTIHRIAFWSGRPVRSGNQRCREGCDLGAARAASSGVSVSVAGGALGPRRDTVLPESCAQASPSHRPAYRVTTGSWGCRDSMCECEQSRL